MRKMRNKDGHTINVIEHIILRNFWEYYVTDQNYGEGLQFCLVLGDYDELGDVYLPELSPYIVSRTKKLTPVIAAPGWEWES
jgi:hypothetical protein